MSVRERPVASRYLDMQEKELKYRQHVRTLKTCKARIDTKEEPMAPRFRIAARNQAIFREKMRKRNAEHTRMIEDVRRPKTASTFTDIDDIPLFPSKPKQSYYNNNDEIEIFRKEYPLSRPNTGKPRRQNQYMSDSIESTSMSSEPLTMESEPHDEISPRQNENITIGTVDQRNSSKVLIITDKGKEPPSMFLLPSENPSSSTSTSTSDSDDEHHHHQNYQQPPYESDNFYSTTEAMDSSSAVHKYESNENTEQGLNLRKVIDDALNNTNHN